MPTKCPRSAHEVLTKPLTDPEPNIYSNEVEVVEIARYGGYLLFPHHGKWKKHSAIAHFCAVLIPLAMSNIPLSLPQSTLFRVYIQVILLYK